MARPPDSAGGRRSVRSIRCFVTCLVTLAVLGCDAASLSNTPVLPHGVGSCSVRPVDGENVNASESDKCVRAAEMAERGIEAVAVAAASIAPIAHLADWIAGVAAPPSCPDTSLGVAAVEVSVILDYGIGCLSDVVHQGNIAGLVDGTVAAAFEAFDLALEDVSWAGDSYAGDLTGSYAQSQASITFFATLNVTNPSGNRVHGSFTATLEPQIPRLTVEEAELTVQSTGTFLLTAANVMAEWIAGSIAPVAGEAEIESDTGTITTITFVP